MHLFLNRSRPSSERPVVVTEQDIAFAQMRGFYPWQLNQKIIAGQNPTNNAPRNLF